jgi:hypothetical protein
MVTRKRSAVVHLARIVVGAWATLHVGLANATFIDFDDLPPPISPEFFSTPITDQYVTKGLRVDEAYLTVTGATGANQALLGTQFMHLSFLNTLPTFVSLSVSSADQDQVYLTAHGPGYSQNFTSSGWGGDDAHSTPYRPNELVSFASASGIASLDLSSFYFMRTGPIVDNLYFGSIPAVPEPPALMLLGIGVLILALSALKRSHTESR